MKSEVRSQTNGVRTICAPSGEFLSATKRNAQCGQECPHSVRVASRSGATLVVTLGILALLSVIVTGFFVSARLNRQVGASDQNRATARNQIDETIYLAMRFIEESMRPENYTQQEEASEDNIVFSTLEGQGSRRRLAPIPAWSKAAEDSETALVGPWLTDEYSNTNGFDITTVTYQALDVLTSPTLVDTEEDALPPSSVNLLTPQVLRLLPPIITNQIEKTRTMFGDRAPLVSGWHALEPLPYNGNAQVQLLANPSRIAFVAINCSSIFDANHFEGGPTDVKRAAVCFSQPDVTNWVNSVGGSFTNLEGVVNYTLPEESPFGFLSYDPGPDTYPLERSSVVASRFLGTPYFNAWPSVDLNDPSELPSVYVQSNLADSYQPPVLPTKEGDGAVYSKFNINSITNEAWGVLNGSAWYNNATFRERWLDPVAFLLKLTLVGDEYDGDPRRIPGYRDDNAPLSAFAWAVANQIDPGRVPRVSDFPTTDNPEPAIYSRADYALKDVPLINKVHVFNIFDEGGGINPDAPQTPAYYGLTDMGLSNHYAVAIELWYPFAPHDPPEDAWCYVGVVTNAMDATTTTNRAWSADELADWLAWRDAGRSNTVMQLLFEQWGQQYRTSSVSNQFLGVYSSAQTVGFDYHYDPRRGWVWEQRLEDHPLWQTITSQKDLWFTPGMTGHPSWPGVDTNGVVDLQDTPIWQAFYPDTTNIAGSTYAVGVVVTNYAITWLHGVETDDGDSVVVTTNRLKGVSWEDYYTHYYLSDMYHGEMGTLYPTLLWENPDKPWTALFGGTSTRGQYIDFKTTTDKPSPLTKTYKRLLSLSMDYGGEDICLIVNNVTTELTPYTERTNVFGVITREWGGGPGSPTAERVIGEAITTNWMTSLVLQDSSNTNLTAYVMGEAKTPLVDVDVAHILCVDYEVIEQVPPLPREGVEYIWDALDALFSVMPTDSLDALEQFLLLRIGEDGDWDSAFLDFFNDNLGSINRLLRSHQTPARTGGRREHNYLSLPTPGSENEWVTSVDARTSTETETYGIYYTVFPKNFVCFPEEDQVLVSDTGGPDGGPLYESVTNYFALGQMSGDGSYRYRLWVNPAVALEDGENIHSGDDRVGHVYLDDGLEAGCIVDEALLVQNQEQDFLPIEWYSIGVRYAPDPRRNAWAEEPQWLWLSPDPEGGLILPGTVMRYGGGDRDATDLANYNWAVRELPFIVRRAPFESIGDLGDVYVPYKRYYDNAGGRYVPKNLLSCDTVTFATRSGAALLDVFTLAPANRPRYGLVQPNTTIDPIVKTLFAGGHAGWTNTLDTTTQHALQESPGFEVLTDLYVDAVTLAPYNIGWRSFADMMPMLLSFDKFSDDRTAPERIELDTKRNEIENGIKENYHARHDYLEDIMRGLIDKVSFRQNIYMVVVAAQTLSRSSTPQRPVVLADQRALVTVIRDAWSGRWAIHDWKWLTE